MTNEVKEEEVWKTYSEFPFIEVSNFGNVRTKDRYVSSKNGSKRLVKGHVLKQYLQKNGYLSVAFKVNGKQFNRLVHRMVSICFIPNLNNYPEVNHIDNDRTNNSVNNLEWCTRKYNEAYKKNFGTPQAELFGRPVFAVNLRSGKVIRFESQREAARQLGINQGDISMVVKGKLNQAGGYWFTENRNEITEKKIQEIKAKMVFLGGVITVNLDTFDILYFESQSEAARHLGVSVGNLNMVLKGQRNKTGGCWFCYADDNVVEKTRIKFGDEVAKKVKKLMSERKTM